MSRGCCLSVACRRFFCVGFYMFLSRCISIYAVLPSHANTSTKSNIIAEGMRERVFISHSRFCFCPRGNPIHFYAYTHPHRSKAVFELKALSMGKAIPSSSLCVVSPIHTMYVHERERERTKKIPQTVHARGHLEGRLMAGNGKLAVIGTY